MSAFDARSRHLQLRSRELSAHDSARPGAPVPFIHSWGGLGGKTSGLRSAKKRVGRVSAVIAAFSKAFADIKIEIIDVIGGPDKAAVPAVITGT